jgi:hypothetical protein
MFLMIDRPASVYFLGPVLAQMSKDRLRLETERCHNKGDGGIGLDHRQDSVGE